MENETNKENINVAVIYSDGSAMPNPGFYGSGAHGYIYNTSTLDTKNGDKPAKYVISDIGYLENELLPKYVYKTVVPDYYIDAAYSYLNAGTNNIGEIMGLVETISSLLEHEEIVKINKYIVKTDSKYLLHIIRTIKEDTTKGWKDRVDTNKEYWYMCEDIINKLNDRNATIEMVKVLGHSTSLGNHLADRLAYLARVESSNRSIEKRFTLSPAKKYWNIEDNQHPMLKFKQLFFTNNLRSSNPEIIYSIMDYKTDVEPGKKTHEATFGLVILKEPPVIIEETIKAYQKATWTRSVVSTLDLSVLYSRNNVHYFNLYKDKIYTYYTRSTALCNLEDVPLIYTIRPTGLATQALEKMQVLYDIIKEYREYKVTNKATRKYIDITDSIYDKSGKKVVTLLPNGTNELVLKKEINNREVTVALDLGRDCLSRNQLKQLEKDNTVVNLVMKDYGKYIEYYTLVETENGDIGIFCNFYSGRIFG